MRSRDLLVLFILFFFITAGNILMAQQENEPLGIIAEFDTINRSIESLKNEVTEYSNSVEERVQNVEKQLAGLSAKLSSLEKDLNEFKAWVKEQEKKRADFEKEMSEGVEIRGTVNAPSNKYTTR